MPPLKIAALVAVLLAAALASLSPATASTVLSSNELKIRSDVIVVGKGDFSDQNTPLAGVIRPGRVLKGARQAEYRIEIQDHRNQDPELPPPWLPTEDYVKATFYLMRQDDGRYRVIGTDDAK